MRLAALGALAGLFCLAPQPPPPVAGVTATTAWRVVPTERLLEAMKEMRAYELTATANGPRLQADVVLALVHEAQAKDPERRPLFIGHREWYEAFLPARLPPSKAPLRTTPYDRAGPRGRLPERDRGRVGPARAGASGRRERPDLLGAGAADARRVLL
jgi:hypothetical protein